MTEKQTVPDSPELIAARAKLGKLQRDKSAQDEYRAEQHDRIARAEKSLEQARAAWRAEDDAAAKARNVGGYVSTTSAQARAEFRSKVEAEIADARARLGVDADGFATPDARKSAQMRADLLRDAETRVAELEARHANACLLAGAPELTEALAELAEQLKVAAGVTYAGVSVSRTSEGVVTLTLRTAKLQKAERVEDDTPIARLRARVAGQSRSGIASGVR